MRPPPDAPAHQPAAGEEKPAWVRFYGAVVGEAELLEAAKIEGLDGEIAMLRKKLREHSDKHPEDLTFMLRCVEVIARMVGARYRMSPQRAGDLAGHMAAVVRSINDQIEAGSAGDV